MAKHGTIGPFCGEAEDWLAYMETLEQYFVVNEITTNAKKRAILLSGCGTPTYKLIRSLVAPQKPSEVDYDKLIKKSASITNRKDPLLSNASNFTPGAGMLVNQSQNSSLSCGY